jgi:hypothetical protein
MKSAEPNPAGLFSTSKGKEVIAAIAEHARQRQANTSPQELEERLLSWESVTEFGDFRITVRCEYGMNLL